MEIDNHTLMTIIGGVASALVGTITYLYKKIEHSHEELSKDIDKVKDQLNNIVDKNNDDIFDELSKYELKENQEYKHRTIENSIMSLNQSLVNIQTKLDSFIFKFVERND
jgi:Ser-tRNA(Ala) deacylase AlaX